ncbi:hypothetical protein EVAR_19291_1 [Eumeta japonica]|uniref:Uncharacterized protein n=1 Tax=Eumeta variegata TaxID=151549 RepID=A0A4C1UD92_EUMVA|nr:hypothetical protein EVAR_19291_1 [Eumeta japonica]
MLTLDGSNPRVFRVPWDLEKHRHRLEIEGFGHHLFPANPKQVRALSTYGINSLTDFSKHLANGLALTIENSHACSGQSVYVTKRLCISIVFSVGFLCILGVRSPAPNGRYRAPAPSALTKLFAFVQIAARDPPGPADRESARRRHAPQLIIYYFRSNRWLLNGVNKVICSEPRALAFPLQRTANPDGPGTTGLEGCSSPIPGVARPPSIILTPCSTPFARSITNPARIRSC